MTTIKLNRFTVLVGILLALSIFLIGCTPDPTPTSAARQGAIPTPTPWAETPVRNRSTPVPVPVASESNYELIILHNNDGESQLRNLGSGFEEFGGAAQFSAFVQFEKLQSIAAARTANAGLIMVSSGDNFLAGLGFSRDLQTGIFNDAIALDKIGYDVITLGNHDFDFGPEVLADFIKQVSETKPPFISSNLDFSGEPELRDLVNQGRIAKSVVVVKSGERIGIIGATTPMLSFISSPRRVRVIVDVAGEVQAEVDRLEASGVNKIVLLSHLQDVDAEIALVGQIHGVDVVVAGGGDELLANACDRLIPDRDEIFGPYPIMATDRDGTEVPVVTTAGQYSYLGKLVVTFDPNGNLLSVDETVSGPIRIAQADRPGMPPIDCLFFEEIEGNEPIASNEVALDGRRSEVRFRETNLGNLMADALLWLVTRLAAEYGTLIPDVAIQNGGGIRNDSVFSIGKIRELDTFDMAPFSNFATVVEEVSRNRFKEVLENAVSRAVEGDIDGGTGRFAQVSGFSFEWSASGTAQVFDDSGSIMTTGTRIQRVVLDTGEVIVGGGKVVPGAPLTVATADFLARGGDQYPFQGAPFTVLGVTYQKGLADYIELSAGLGGVITAADYPEGGEGRIVRLP